MMLFTPNPNRLHHVLAYTAWTHADALSLADLGTALLTADALHLADYGRPVTGDIWDGEPPVPLGRITRRLLNREPCALAMLTPVPPGKPSLPRYLLEGDRVLTLDSGTRCTPGEDKVFRCISETDRVALRAALGQAEGDEVDAARTRALRAWRRALGGVMDYAGLVPEDVLQAPGFQEHIDLAPMIKM